MTFKTLMMSTAATIALSLPAWAESHVDVDADTEVEMEETPSTDMETDAEVDTDADTMTTEGDVETDAESDMSTDMDGEADVDTDMSSDADMDADASLDQLSQFSGMTVDEIVGLKVLGAEGEDVGEIDYIFADGEDYMAVIGIGGFLGLGEYTVALPLGNFSMVEDDLILDSATPEELEAMPELDESEIEALEGDYVIN